MRALALLPVAVAACLADTATQTDWSGGPGVPGPAGSWADAFSTGNDIDWIANPGTLELCDTSIEHFVCGGLSAPMDLQWCPIDGDGHADLALAAGRRILWWENSDTAPGSCWTGHTVWNDTGVNISAFTMGDADTDGDPDAVAACAGVFWWENEGGGDDWGVRTIDHDMTSVVGELMPTDMDGNGFTDLLGTVPYYDTIYWWDNMDGTGSNWYRRTVTSSFPDPGSAFPADMDGDGDLDVASGSSTQGTVAWWENADGQGTSWIEHSVGGSLPQVLSVRAGDLDGDGDADIVTAAMTERGGVPGSQGALTWWENADGAGSSWIEHEVPGAPDHLSRVTAADLDADGDADLAVANNSTSAPSCWFENADGSGLAWITHWLTGGTASGGDISACDPDSDGDTDLAGTTGGSAGAPAAVNWWDLDGGRASSGWLESGILYTGNDPDWEMLSWSATVPAGTAAGFQVRASDDPAAMGAWSDTLWAPSSLQGILADNASYMQYRAILMTTDPAVTPVLEDVTVAWDPLVTGGGEAPPSFQLLPVTPDPCTGPPSIEFGLPSPGLVDLAVFDITGRQVEVVSPVEYQAGWQAVQLGALRPGVYFVRMRAGEYEAAERFVVIR